MQLFNLINFKKEADYMYSEYYLTGATGFLGSHVLSQLLKSGAKVNALILPNDKNLSLLPKGVTITYGDVTDMKSLEDWTANITHPCCLIHSAGIIYIGSAPNKKLAEVNVGGTANIIKLCRERGIDKLVHVSSVHAIPELPDGKVMSEISEFSPDKVSGWYAKSKAKATALVLDAAKKGLNASVIHPSGIIGPGDIAMGSTTSMLISYCEGKLPVSVKGGYDFVDVRDVADGVIACCEKGERGQCYILSGEYVSVDNLLNTASKITGRKRPLFTVPLKLASMAASLVEKVSLKMGKKPYFTPYAVMVLGTNAKFSHRKATEKLGYSPRRISETLRDTIEWIKRTYLPKTA